MDLEYFFRGMWDEITPAQRRELTEASKTAAVEKGKLLKSGSSLYAVSKGRLRVFINSYDGREVTLYRLLKGDFCLFSASCILENIKFDILIEAETDSEIIEIPHAVYQGIMETSAAAANFTNKIMAARFSNVMWLMEQILFKRMDSRIASFLLEESEVENRRLLTITHDRIASHIGTAREVVTRMLKYFQSEGIVKLSRGVILITDADKLKDLADR